ncbi:MAG: AAA family ATPase, partial [Lachnospiraceae bacterium]|nr:AAA family ATPase [Lachnospiraceae bacterium]
MFKPLPVGIEFFEKLIKNDYYYVDKTPLIKELIDNHGEVNLFTRPRRFGKTLTLDMLRCFFEEGRNPEMFRGLRIMEAGEKYTSMMGKYPVIFLTLKSAKTNSFYGAFMGIRDQIIQAFQAHEYVLSSPDMDEETRETFRSFRNTWSRFNKNVEKCGRREEREELLKSETDHFKSSLAFLCSCIKQYHEKNPILLIDEYDVPLESSFYGGFYDEMVDFIRSLFEQSLKTNQNLEFAVITGCLRISKESIFTGLNNLSINSIRSSDYGEYFGFTDEEVYAMLEYYGLADKYEEVSDWYNGYIFGGKNVYNPWSTIEYVRQH